MKTSVLNSMDKMMRPNKRDEIIRNALEIFYNTGFQATGMDRLVAETGISKTSFYKHFRTKDDLILAVLRLRDENFRNWFCRRIEELSDKPQGRLLAIFDALGEWFAEEGFRGCMFIKASAEFQDPAHPAHVQSAEHKRLVLEYVTGLAKDAGAEQPAICARQLLLLKEGAIVTAVMGFTPNPAADAKHAAALILAQHITDCRQP